MRKFFLSGGNFQRGQLPDDDCQLMALLAAKEIKPSVLKELGTPAGLPTVTLPTFVICTHCPLAI